MTIRQWHWTCAALTLPLWLPGFVVDVVRNPPRRWS